jgi:cytochrome c oxidase subunit 4
MTEHVMQPAPGVEVGEEMGGSAHVVPVRLYLIVFGALMVLTAITVTAALIDLGPFNTVVALTIACTKMVLVILFFMHVRYSSRLTWATVGAGFFFLGLLLLMTLSDYLTRGPGWLHFG